jgi:heme/copper-type cytochrome/quinol oxidase subunit 2
MSAPKLIENNVKNYLYFSLQKCHQYRVQFYSVLFNIAVFVVFVVVFGTTLFFCWKKKPNKIDLERKRAKDQELILSKIRYFQQVKQHQKESMNSLTNLPVTENLADSLHDFG